MMLRLFTDENVHVDIIASLRKEGFDVITVVDILDKIRTQARLNEFRFTQHAQQEMAEEGICLEEVLEALETGEVLENYPEHRRGACCLTSGTA